MAKLKACSSSIQVTPSGNGLPSVCSQAGRLVRAAAADWARPRSATSASITWIELFNVPFCYAVPAESLPFLFALSNLLSLIAASYHRFHP